MTETDGIDGLTFAPLDESMLDACAAIAQNAPDPWSRASLAAALEGWRFLCPVALYEDRPVAFACFLEVSDTADLEMVVVDDTMRRHGIAERLLRHAFVELGEKGVRRVLLEARCSNTGALALYKKLGFAQLAHRPGMYMNPKEDGLLLAKTIR